MKITVLATGRLGISLLLLLATAPLLAEAPEATLAYSSYFPGSVRAVAVVSAGNAYLTGGREDAFVAKLDGSGALVWWFTFGGSGADEGRDVAVDAAGSAYVAGTTRSADFPRVRALQPPLSEGGEDAFLVKIDPSGTRLLFASNLGGSGDDEGVGVALDPAGHVYLAGTTRSADFPVAAALDSELGGPADAFVMKLRPDLSGFVYSTFLGGSRWDSASGLAIDPSGEATMAGPTGSPDFPIVEAIQSELSEEGSSFVARVSAAGDSLVFSSFFGCGLMVTGLSAADSGEVTLVGGAVYGPPWADPWGPENWWCGPDGHHGYAFATTITRTGRLIRSTFVDGVDAWSSGVATDRSGNAFVVGFTETDHFPAAIEPIPLDPCGGGFIAQLDPDGARSGFSSCLPGGDALDVAVDASGNLVVIGRTSWRDIPLVNAFHPTPTGLWVARIVFNDPPDCSAARATPATLWPPNGKLVPIRVQGVEDPDGDPVTVAFTGVRQDEPLTRPGSPDATGVGTGTLLLRADRAGKGDGRVYHVVFEGRDPLGASCTGEVTVCVPHDSRKGVGCGDGGAVFDSSLGG